jgi:hypothetical protein
LIISALRKHLAEESNNKAEVQRSLSLNDKELISTHIARVDVKPDHLAVQLSVKPDHRGGERVSSEGGTLDRSNPNIMVVPWRKTPSKRRVRSFSPPEHLLIWIYARSEPRPAPGSS